MNVEIWRFLAQIIYFRNDLSEIIKPFFDNLKNENINDEKYIPFLKTFSKNQLKVLYENGIITGEKFNLLISENQKENQSSTKETIEETNSTVNDINTKIDEIISGDKIKELEKLLQEKDIRAFNTITKSFLEIKEMQIPLIQYCVMKKAIECFKYLLVNGFDDPNETMKEHNPLNGSSRYYFSKIKFKRYEWDCIATAIYFGNTEIVKILEEKGFERGKNATHIEAAIISYRNIIAKLLIEGLNENEDQLQNLLDKSIIASAKSNNIKAIELLISKGADINAIDIIYLYIIILFLIKII